MTKSPPVPVARIIQQEDPAQPDVLALLRHGEAHSAWLYSAESIHHLALEGLRKPNVRFFVAREANGAALATGAIVLQDGWAEIKRVWVEEHARGQGLARQVLDALIAETCRSGIAVLRLETGVASHAALALYAKAGFKCREPFAGYVADPQSVFMEKSDAFARVDHALNP